MTDAELAAGIAALESYVKGIDPLEAIFAPTSIYQTAVMDIVTAADESTDQTPAGRQAAAQVAMRAAIDSSGYGSEISDQECHDGTAVVLAAVNKAVALAARSFVSSASLSEEFPTHIDVTTWPPVTYPAPNEWLAECYPTRSDQNMVEAYTDFAIRIYNETIAQQIEEIGSASTTKPLSIDGTKWNNDWYTMWKTIAEIFGMIANALEKEGHDMNNGPLLWIRNSSWIG